MASTTYLKGEPCSVENCRSKLFYEQDGLRYCKKNDHQQQDGLRVAEDQDAFKSSQGATSRVKHEAKAKVVRVLSGQPALELYLESYQLILRELCRSLIQSKGLTKELEMLVRDLWLLRASLILKALGTDPANADGAEEEQQGGNAEPELFSSQTDVESSDKDQEKKPKERATPTIVDSLALCYMALMLLRVPISLGDFFRWATDESIPFLRPVRLLPDNMRRRLPPRYSVMLDTHSMLEPDDLQRSLFDLHALYDRNFNVQLPPLNYHPLLVKHLKGLSLPILLHQTVEHISTAFLPDIFLFTAAKSRQNTPRTLPETQLLALLVVATVLHHPFDGLKRYARFDTELSYLQLDWAVWSAARRTAAEETMRASGHPFPPGGEVRATEADAMKMTPEQTDAYMDWYARTFLSLADDNDNGEHHWRGGASAEILRMFPTERHELTPRLAPPDAETVAFRKDVAKNRCLEKVIREGLKPRGLVSDESAAKYKKQGKHVPRVGYKHAIYKTEGELSGHAREFFQSVAEAGGLSVATLVEAVVRVERKLVKMRKESQGGEPMEGVEEEVEVSRQSSKKQNVGR